MSYEIRNGKVVPKPYNPNNGFWNYEPCRVEKVRVIVGPAPSGWWCHGLTGTERNAVRVDYQGEKFYLDNDAHDDHEAGAAWLKVTLGRGSPKYGHRSLPVERELS